MLDVDNSVLEIEIANILNRSNTKIIPKRTTVSVHTLPEGRRRCRIELSGETGHGEVKASFDDILCEGFFVRAESSLALQLEPNAGRGNTPPTP